MHEKLLSTFYPKQMNEQRNEFHSAPELRVVILTFTIVYKIYTYSFENFYNIRLWGIVEESIIVEEIRVGEDNAGERFVSRQVRHIPGETQFARRLRGMSCEVAAL